MDVGVYEGIVRSAPDSDAAHIPREINVAEESIHLLRMGLVRGRIWLD